MKKIVTLLMVLVLGIVLVACGDGAGEKPENEQPNGNNAGNNEGGTEEIGAGEVDNAFFKQVAEKLEEKGFEVKPAGYEVDPMFLDVVENQRLEINKEDFMPLEIYEIEKDSEHLATAEETGEFPVEFEGEKGTLPVEVKDNYIFFLAEGHPDFDAIFEAIHEIE